MYKIFAPIFFIALPVLAFLTVYCFFLVFSKIYDKLEKRITKEHRFDVSLVVSILLTSVIFIVAFFSVISVPSYIEYITAEVKFIDITPSVRPGDEVRVIIKGKPEESYSLIINDKEYNAPELKTDDEGIAKYIIKVPKKTESGEYSLIVKLKDDKKDNEEDFGHFNVIEN